MTVDQLAKECNLKAVVLADGSREVEGVYIGDLLSWVMGRAQSGDAWITIMSNVNVIAVASLVDVSCVILAEGVKLDAGVEKTAEAKGINILGTDKSAYEIAKQLASLAV